MTVPGLILAGGTSRRMGGGDKVLLPLGGRTLLDAVAERLAPQVSALALSANGPPARFAGPGLPVLPDELADAGPLAGILAGLDWAAGLGAASLVSVAGDTPFLPPDLVERLRSAARSSPAGLAVAASPDGDHPTCGLWPVALRGDLRRALHGGLRRVGEWGARHGAARAEFPDDSAFFNVNAPEDLRRAEALLRQRGAVAR